MSTTRTLATAITGLAAASALIGMAATASATPAPAQAGRSTSAEGTSTTREHGHVIECTGTYRGAEAFVSVYENDRFANVLQVVVGDDGTGASREVEAGFVDGRHVEGRLRLQGKTVLVTGSARRVGGKVRVHEEHDDAGQHIVVDGYHRNLVTDLTMSWKGTTIALDCDNAFYYNLKVQKTDITG